MFARISLLAVAMFWLTMTYLLWRSEYVGHNQVGSTVPLELVWRKIRTAPDNSSLEIIHQGRKVGYCRWASNVGQYLSSGKFLADDSLAEGAPTGPVSYRLDLEGNVALNDMPNRLRFDFELKLTTNDLWQDFDLRLNLKPTIWEVHSHAREETIRLIAEDKTDRMERVIKFSELQNPQALLQGFDLPVPLGLLGMMNPLSNDSKAALPSLGIHWQARNDWITIGHTSVRAYRLEASLLDRYRMMIIVSRVGEILRVKLPDGWELINDQLN